MRGPFARREGSLCPDPCVQQWPIALEPVEACRDMARVDVLTYAGVDVNRSMRIAVAGCHVSGAADCYNFAKKLDEGLSWCETAEKDNIGNRALRLASKQ